MSGDENKGGGRMQTVNRGVTATNIGTQLAQGQYGWAAVSTVTTAVMTPKTWEAAAKLTKSAGEAAKLLKRVPGFVGPAVTLGFMAYEMGTALSQGNTGKAGAAFAAGVTEMAVNAVGGGLFGASDVARQAVVEGIVAAGGERANDAYLVAVGKRAATVGSKFVNGSKPDPKAIEAQQHRLIQGDATLPDQVTIGGKKVDLDDALRNPTFARTFRENLVKADHAGQLDSKPLIAKLDQFDKLERQRVAAVNSDNHTTTASSSRPTTLRPGSNGLGA